jgi:hypothetical protein
MAGGRETDMGVEDIPLILTWYEDATDAARALGLDIDLPDVGCTDDDYWKNFDRKAWREALKGKVDMDPAEIDRCDPDWVLLKRIDGGLKEGGIEIWFDLEDGVRIRCTIGTAAKVARIIHEAASRGGLKLSETWPGNVVAMETRHPRHLPSFEKLSPIMEPAGYFWEEIWWVMRVNPRWLETAGECRIGFDPAGPGGR